MYFFLSFCLFCGFYTEGVAQCGCTDCRCSDSLELVRLYDATNGNQWLNSLRNDKKWKVPGVPISNWYGITTNSEGRVIDISLGNDSLRGTLPNLNLPSLKYFTLDSNQLFGKIPNFNLPNLIAIEFRNNQLNESIPKLDSVPQLEYLSLPHNQLTGNIPNITLPKLVNFYLHNNRLSGNIPNFNLPNLKYLFLGDNQLTGTIPNFQYLPNLETLGLNYNPLTGSSIPNFNLLPNLQNLYLNNCGLVGIIPNFQYLTNLQLLVLHDNLFSGTIPSFSLPNLTYLNVSQNPQLGGNIPDFNLPKLQQLWISQTKVTGGIPTSIGNLRQLISLHISSNSLLNGTIPSSIGLLTSLEVLGLGSNNLSGTIPNEVGNCRNLKHLFFDSNKSLEGSIPSSIGNLKRLKILWLSGNKLSGTIPPSLGLLDSLEDLALNHNQLTGSVPTTFNQLKVKRLIFSLNRLNSLPNLTNIPLKDSIIDVNRNRAVGGLLADNNALTFESILHNISFSRSTTFTYSPQDSIFKDTTIKIIPNTPLSISLGIDSTVTTNSYQWYKNSQPFGVATSSNTLTINALTFEHAGVYTCTVSNPNAPNLKLYSRPIRLTTGRTDTKKIETSITPNGDGINDALDFPDANLEGHPENSIEIYNRWGQLVYKASPYKRNWTGQDSNGQLLPAGDYFFVMRVSIGDGQIIVGSVYLSR